MCCTDEDNTDIKEESAEKPLPPYDPNKAVGTKASLIHQRQDFDQMSLLVPFVETELERLHFGFVFLQVWSIWSQRRASSVRCAVGSSLEPRLQRSATAKL